MRLTLHTDFALRVLIHVGINDGRLSTIKDIADGFGISKNHLMKIVNDSRADLIAPQQALSRLLLDAALPRWHLCRDTVLRGECARTCDD
jgi:hypothetical protein